MPVNSGRHGFTTNSHSLHILSKYLSFQREAYGLLIAVSLLVGKNASSEYSENTDFKSWNEASLESKI